MDPHRNREQPLLRPVGHGEVAESGAEELQELSYHPVAAQHAQVLGCARRVQAKLLLQVSDTALPLLQKLKDANPRRMTEDSEKFGFCLMDGLHVAAQLLPSPSPPESGRIKSSA